MFYNTNCQSDGVWCSGSTKASDSFGVGSIPTTPAKRPLQRDVSLKVTGVLFLPFSVLPQCGYYFPKLKMHSQSIA